MLYKKTTTVPLQIIICFSTILLVSVLCFWGRSFLSYKTDALVLLLTVSILAMLFEMWPVLIAAVSSALIWNFFFIPPIFTFHVGTTEDGLMFLMYFVIALVNAVLTIQIKRERKKLQKKEEEAMIIRLYNTVLSSLSHELKTPISTIIGSVDMLENDSVQLTPEQKKELVGEIGIAGQRLNRQITNLLQMSRLDSGVLQPKLDWCDLEDLTYQIIYTSGAEKRIKFSSPKPMPLIKIDEFWLEVILQNLVINELHYTVANTQIEITITHAQPELEIIISDSGPGIPDFDLERIFDKFYRLPNSAHQGSGIGLSIVKGYIEALNGKVFARNNEKGGADFVLRLPVEVSYVNQLEHD